MRRFVYVTRAVAWRTLHNTLVSPALLMPSIIFPLFFLAAFAGGLSRVGDVPNFDYKPGYTAFQFCFVFLQSAAFGGVFTGFGVARDFEAGFARRLLLSAPRRSGIIAGYAVGALARWALTAVVVTAAALIVGMPVDGGAVDLFGMIGLGVLFNLGAVLWGCGVAMMLRTEQAGPLIQMPVFVVLFLAPVYVPLRLLGGWIHAVASVNPANSPRAASSANVAGSPVKVGAAYLLLAVAAVLMAAWARRGLASAERAG